MKLFDSSSEEGEVQGVTSADYMDAVIDISNFLLELDCPENAPYEIGVCNEVWHFTLRKVRKEILKKFLGLKNER